MPELKLGPTYAGCLPSYVGPSFSSGKRKSRDRGTPLAHNACMSWYLRRSRRPIVGLAVIGVILTSLVLGCRSDRAAQEKAAIQAALADRRLGRESAVPPRARPAIRRFYELRGFTFAWAPGKSRSAADDGLALIARAEDHGLDRASYGYERLRVARQRLGEEPPKNDAGRRDLARFDVQLTASLISLGHDIAVGHTRPRQWRAQRKLPDLAATLSDARNGTLATWLDRIHPPHREYADLLAALAALRGAAAKGGWPAVSFGRGKASAALVRRLELSGDLEAGKRSTPDTMRDAIASFQSHHGLPPNGRIDRATVAAMNVPLAERIRQVRINLERWRWMPDDLGARRIMVNIPEFHLKVIDGDDEVLDIRAIVGRAGDETPVLSGTMINVVFSPYWNIPETIAMDETLPEIANDPEFLERNNIEVVRAGTNPPELVDAASVDWSDPETLKGLSLRQRPGEQNALGLVKFLFPNPKNVYVHDTPGDHLFSRIGRTFSHGCIRIEQPIALAEYVLRDQREWTPEVIQAAMNAGVEKHVKITTPIPIHLTYFTAWIDANGGLHFRNDVYGYDGSARRPKADRRLS
jgi:L,D-transpeptidase YcbB